MKNMKNQEISEKKIFNLHNLEKFKKTQLNQIKNKGSIEIKGSLSK